MQITKPPSFERPGFAFRQLEHTDKEAWYAYLSLQCVYEHTSWSLTSADDLSPMLDAYQSTASHSMRRLAIVDTNNGKLAGTIGFHTVSDGNRSAELAYDVSPDYWGQGLATAAARTIVQWAQQEYGWIRIQATTLTTNQRSMRVLEKCGFEFEGVLRAYRMVRGTPGHFNMFALINGPAS